MKLLYATLFFFLSCSVSPAQDTLTIKDLSDEWSFYSARFGGYVPLVKKSIFKGETVNFVVDAEEYPGADLQINSTHDISVFIEGRLISVVDGPCLWSIDSLSGIYGLNKLPITLYSPKLNPSGLSSKIVTVTPHTVAPLQGGVKVSKRNSSMFSNFFLTAFFVLLVALTALYFFYPKVLLEYFRIRRAVAFRETEENLLKSRPLSSSNIILAIFFSLITGLLLIGILHLAGVRDSPWFAFNSFAGGIWVWFKITGMILLWLFLKLVLVNYLTRLFKLGNFFTSHHFNYIRLNLMFLSVGLIAVVFSRFSLAIVDVLFYHKMFIFLLVGLAMSILIISLKLMNGRAYKNMHLISYLCATEIAPYGLFLSLGINQSF